MTSTPVTKASIAEAGRLVRPFVIRVVAIERNPNSRVATEMEVEDLEGARLPLKIWHTHGDHTNWQIDHWYTLLDARVNLWETEETANIVLNSSVDFEVLHHGSEKPPIDELTRASEGYDAVERDTHFMDKLFEEFDL